jgi:hypothetical protein
LEGEKKSKKSATEAEINVLKLPKTSFAGDCLNLEAAAVLLSI